jgi:hypothetical protein
MLCKLMFRCPRSTWPTKVQRTPAWSASFSWLNPSSCRRARTRPPNAAKRRAELLDRCGAARPSGERLGSSSLSTLALVCPVRLPTPLAESHIGRLATYSCGFPDVGPACTGFPSLFHKRLHFVL